MDFFTQLITQAAGQVWITFTHNWPFLIISTLIAGLLKLYFDPQKVSAFLTRYQSGGVIGATALAVGTPLCSCGTTAVVLGMMASTLPWAPIIAFMVSSPLSSPEGVVYSAGLFGWPFSWAFFGTSVALGLLGGAVGWFFESRGWLKNQTRYQTAPAPASSQASACSCNFKPVLALQPILAIETGQSTGCSCGPTPAPVSSSAFGYASNPVPARITWKAFITEMGTTGQRLLVMFLGFAFIGYLLNGLIPAEWVAGIFGKGNIYSVPLAATLGLPLYINSEASLPLVRALIDGGMSQGAAMAFLITGSGTSIGAVTGALTIARWRVIALVVGTLWVGAIAAGSIYNLLLAAGLF